MTDSASLPAEPREQTDRRTERRMAIVDVAAPLFAQLGYTDCDMERVATELGIAKGTLYLYFEGKQELFFACVDWGMRQMQQTVHEAANSTTDPFEKVGRGVKAYLSFFEEHPHFVELLIQERAIFKDRKRPTYFEYRDANRWVWRDLYTNMIAAGQMRPDIPVERICDTIGSLLYGTMFTNHFAGRTASLDEQYHAILETLFRGLLSDQERPGWKLP